MTYDYDQLYKDLTSVSVQTKLYKTVQRALKKRGNWKNQPRGAYARYGVVGSKLHQ